MCSYKVGTLKAPESLTSAAANKEVHILYDHVPQKLVPQHTARRTKWIFITAVGLSKQQVERFYDEGIHQSLCTTVCIVDSMLTGGLT